MHKHASKEHLVDEYASKEQLVHENASKEQLMDKHASKEQLVHENASKEQLEHENASKEQQVDKHASKEQLVHENASKEQLEHEDASKEQLVHKTSKGQLVDKHASKEQLVRTEPGAEQRLHMMHMCMLQNQLGQEVETCKSTGPFSPEQRAKYEEAAKKEAGFLLQCRRENRDDVKDAKALGKKELRAACVDWLKTERKIDEIEFAMRWREPKDDGKLKTEITKLDYFKKVHTLVEVMDAVELAHPWTRSLANTLLDAEERLDA